MSFLKKIQKVFALLSPWGAVKPLKKRRKIRQTSPKKSRIRSLKKLRPRTKKKVFIARESIQRKITRPSSKKIAVTTVRKTALKKAKLKRILVGEVTHYFDRAKVGAFMITGAPIVLGDALEFEGKWGVFRQEIKSLQMDRVPVKSARAGDEVGILVKKPVREGDYVFKVL